MKEFEVQIDVTMSGTIYIEAENEEQAEKIAKEKKFTPQDLRNFYFFSSEVQDIT